MENMLADLSTSWDGLLLITGDLNIDVLKPNAPLTKQYTDFLSTFNLTQHVQKPTRVTPHSETLIDHIISNDSKRVTHADVLPCSNVSDHDAPYTCLNIRADRFVPRFKMIRKKRGFKEEKFVRDFTSLLFSVIQATDDSEEKLEMFTTLITDCIERHAPLTRTKVTRPPAPWLHDEEIVDLQNQRNVLRHKAHSLETPDAWQAFRDVRNRLKTTIKEAKRSFINTALSSSKPKAVWRIIHRILNPCPPPLRLDVNVLNKHFAEVAQRTTGHTDVDAKEDLLNFVDSLQPCLTEEKSFTLHHVKHEEVLREIKSIRSDTSTGPDQIPTKFLKPVADLIAGPLTDVINSCIDTSTFPDTSKIARITPLPNTSGSIFSVSDMRPISILPVLSKVFERLVHHQVIDYIDSHFLLKKTISGFRKGNSTTTVLLGIRDDIIRTMKRGEVTLMVLADFSKAFDTIKYKTVLEKLSLLGFSKEYLKWTIQYLTGRKHFVQVDEKTSELCTVSFGVPQGSIMGPLIFNLYVADLQSYVRGDKCHQYADDTTLYTHCKPADLQSTLTELSASIGKLEAWSREANLVINPSKTKLMLLSTPQLSKVHHLDTDITINSTPLERVTTTKLLGSHIHEHLNWEGNIRLVAASCYATLTTLRKLKNILPFHIKKNLAQALVLSKLYYNDILYHSLPDYLMKRLQRVQKATASFVLGRFVSSEEILTKLKWLPVKEQREWNLLKATHKALHNPHWPSYLKLNVFQHERCLRSLINNNLQDQTASLFNRLPSSVRCCQDYRKFCKDTRNITFKRALELLE